MLMRGERAKAAGGSAASTRGVNGLLLGGGGLAGVRKRLLGVGCRAPL